MDASPSHIPPPECQSTSTATIQTNPTKPLPRESRALHERLGLKKWGLAIRGKEKKCEGSRTDKLKPNRKSSSLEDNNVLSSPTVLLSNSGNDGSKELESQGQLIHFSSDELWNQFEILIDRLLSSSAISISDGMKIVFKAAEFGLKSLEAETQNTSFQQCQKEGQSTASKPGTREKLMQARQARCARVLDLAQMMKEIVQGNGRTPDWDTETAWKKLRSNLSSVILDNQPTKAAPNLVLSPESPGSLLEVAHPSTNEVGSGKLPRKNTLRSCLVASSTPTQELTTAEKVSLLESSRLNGEKFPPWDLVAHQGISPASVSVSLAFPSLSPSQKMHFQSFRRARDALGVEQNDFGGMRAQRPSSLVQDVLPDCSLVASLIVLTAWREKVLQLDYPTHKLSKSHLRCAENDILASIFEQYDSVSQAPSVSLSGVYRLRLFFNGAWRRVVVNDMLPVPHNSRFLHVRDTSNLSLIWPALLEKAYLAVRGGYDRFAGSCPATDLATLTGWIPEQIHLQRDHNVIIPEDVWARLKHGFESGTVMVTLGTGLVDADLGIENWHTYAVIGMKEESVSDVKTLKRQFLIRNPLGKAGPGGVVSAPKPRWVSLDQVTLHFDSLYLNWNPRIFSQKKDTHFKWDLAALSTAALEEHHLVNNPQFSIQSSQGWRGAVWVLLTRHFQNDNQQSGSKAEEISPVQPGSISAVDIPSGFISLLAFSNAGHKVLNPVHVHPLRRTRYVDAPFCLLRLDFDSVSSMATPSFHHQEPGKAQYGHHQSLPPDEPVTIVVSQQNLPPWTHRFSLSIFYSGPGDITLKPAHTALQCMAETKSRWSGGRTQLFEMTIDLTSQCHERREDSVLKATSGSSAGCFNSPSHQGPLSSVVVMLESLDSDVAQPKLLNIKLIKPLPLSAKPPLPSSLLPRQILADSGNYAPRFCFLTAPWEMFNTPFFPASSIHDGPETGRTEVKYHLLASTYIPESRGQFRIHCLSKYPVRLQKVHGLDGFPVFDSAHSGVGTINLDELCHNTGLDGKFLLKAPVWKSVDRIQRPLLPLTSRLPHRYSRRDKDGSSCWIKCPPSKGATKWVLLACLPLSVNRYARVGARVQALLAMPTSSMSKPIATPSSLSPHIPVMKRTLLRPGSDVQTVIRLTVRLVALQFPDGKQNTFGRSDARQRIDFAAWFAHIRTSLSFPDATQAKAANQREEKEYIPRSSGTGSSYESLDGRRKQDASQGRNTKYACPSSSAGTDRFFLSTNTPLWPPQTFTSVLAFEQVIGIVPSPLPSSSATRDHELELSVFLPDADLWPSNEASDESIRPEKPTTASGSEHDEDFFYPSHAVLLECVSCTESKFKQSRTESSTSSGGGGSSVIDPSSGLDLGAGDGHYFSGEVVTASEAATNNSCFTPSTDLVDILNEKQSDLTVEFRVSGTVSETASKDCVRFADWVVS